MAKVYRLSEVKEHNSKDSCWLVIHNKVYDVTKFNDHPGGDDLFYEDGLPGSDASQSFEDIGHSSDAVELMKTDLSVYQIDTAK